MAGDDDRDRLREQQAYYQARAPEYDQWWFRQGRYDHGAELNGQWFAEIRAVECALDAFRPTGRVLELACGTGLWSRRLLPHASALTLVDGSSAALKQAAKRLHSSQARCVQADLFAWEPTEQYDCVFFSFWLSHVPPQRFESFWRLVRRSLAPGGRVFFIDSLREASSGAVDHRHSHPRATMSTRRLNDGQEFHVYKIFHDADVLRERLHGLGWDFTLERTGRYFLYGSGKIMDATGRAA